MRLLLLVLLCGLMHAARSFAPQPGIGSAAAGTALACGFLLLAGFLFGETVKQIGLPRLTGYLVAGLVAGPQVVGFVSDPMVRNLRVFNGVAIALIALTAGSDIDLRELRPRIKVVVAICLVGVLGTAACISATAWAGRGWLPFLTSLPPGSAVAVAVVLGVTLAAQSPAVVVALRDELSADGPVSKTVLAVVVLSDLLLIVLFAAASLFAKSALGGSADAADTALRLAWELLGSAGIGVAVGALISLYLAKIEGGGALFIVVVCFVLAEIGQRIELDPLLLGLGAGMTVRNASATADRLHREISTASLPVYVAFFSLTGAGIELGALPSIGAAAVVLVALRALSFLVLTRLGARAGGAEPSVQRFAGAGMLPQAGLALALALLFRRTFPELREAATLIVVSVAINELIAPVVYRAALVRSGEARIAREDR